MSPSDENSLGAEATFAGQVKRQRADVSLGDERTLGGGDAAGIDTVLDGLEVVDLETRYRIEGTLGQGGMGAVMLATDTRLDRKVAIKRILGEAARSKAAIMRFLTEAKAIAALNHPNVVQIYDYGRAKDGPFLIMEFVEGGSLADRCKDSGLHLEEAVDLACQLCDGLARAHDAGIVHRDIKPANVLLSRDGHPKLTDFGLAKAESADHGMTMTGAVMGTPDFMPPEQRRDASEVDHRSDLWSLAATVYQMVTGRSPKIIRFNDIPPALQDVLGKALEDRKDARYQSAKEFRDALRATAGNAALTVAPVATVVDGDLQDGQCKACGTVNPDFTRKFCKRCGESLRVPCLKCDAQIPVWDTICGECGGNQPAILQAKRTNLEAQQVSAKGLLAAFAFDEARSLAMKIASTSLPELADLAEWGRSFAAQVTEERRRQEQMVAEKLNEAMAHRGSFDYTAAIHALESIPAALVTGDVRKELSTCQQSLDESTRLVGEIAGRLKRKELDGLLTLVDRAVALRGDRADLAKIKGQLTERRDAVLARARAAMDAGNAKAAATVLEGTAASDYGDSAEFVDQVRKAVELESRLAEVIKKAKADGVIEHAEAAAILKLGEEYLRFNPKSEQVRSLVANCRKIVAVPIRNSVGINLKLIPAGTFTMGDGSDSHPVTLTKPFYLGVYPVTNASWKGVMGSVPSEWKDDERPVTNVSWEDAVEFCRKLSALPEERKAGRVYRLPTEAEWEYACRAGTTTAYSFGDDVSQLGWYAWYDKNSGDQTQPVGKKKPNPLGLHDMHGNVWEWCNDWYGEYATGLATDPKGPSSASSRVFRGGSWRNTAGSCRSAFRFGVSPSLLNSVGFRIALSPSGAKPVNETEKTDHARTQPSGLEKISLSAEGLVLNGQLTSLPLLLPQLIDAIGPPDRTTGPDPSNSRVTETWDRLGVCAFRDADAVVVEALHFCFGNEAAPYWPSASCKYLLANDIMMTAQSIKDDVIASGFQLLDDFHLDGDDDNWGDVLYVLMGGMKAEYYFRDTLISIALASGAKYDPDAEDEGENEDGSFFFAD